MKTEEGVSLAGNPCRLERKVQSVKERKNINTNNLNIYYIHLKMADGARP